MTVRPAHEDSSMEPEGDFRDVEGEIVLQVIVVHEPQQVGSKNAFVVYADKKRKIPRRRPDGSIMINVTDENAKAKPFMRAVWAEASKQAAKNGVTVDAESAFELDVDFYVYRTQAHWGTGRNAHLLKPSAPARPTTAPDEDKLLRCTQDALEGIVWANDSQVVRATAEKWYAVPNENNDGEGVIITIRRSPFQTAADLPAKHQTRIVRADAKATADESQLALDAA